MDGKKGPEEREKGAAAKEAEPKGAGQDRLEKAVLFEMKPIE